VDPHEEQNHEQSSINAQGPHRMVLASSPAIPGFAIPPDLCANHTNSLGSSLLLLVPVLRGISQFSDHWDGISTDRPTFEFK
jgi:hypothetical protein